MNICASSAAARRRDSKLCRLCGIQTAFRGAGGNAADDGCSRKLRTYRPEDQLKEEIDVRYAYGLTTALLLGGATLTLATGLPAGAQVAQNDEQKMSQVVPRAGAPASFAELTQQLQPAVVNISTRQKVKVENANPFAGTPFGDLFGGGQDQGGAPGQGGPGGGQTREAQSLGSGFIISADGYVVTNNHVVTADGQGQVESISVTLPDGTELPAKMIGHDEASDLAVLKITAPKPLPFVKFGDASKARVGDWVIAIGNPFGLGGTVTAGIISAVYRNTGSGSAYDRYLQTDAAINRGNSGGPMFDMKGQVIGINNAIFSPNGGSIGIGFAIPADVAAPIVERLMKGQTIERGYLGIRIQPLGEDIADSLGIPHNRGEFVQSVEAGKPAAQAGIQPGDVVLKVNGKDVSPTQSLSFLVANTAPGSRIPIDLIRNGQHLSVTATVGKRPSEEELAQSFDQTAPQSDNPFDQSQRETKATGTIEKSLGLSVVPLTPQIARQVSVPESTHGLVIASVDPSSDAGAKGLQRRDVIVSAAYKPVLTAADLDAAIRAAQAANRPAVLLQVMRSGQPAVYVPVRLR
jgi:serine protease Do